LTKYSLIEIWGFFYAKENPNQINDRGGAIIELEGNA
jgi:hypothetical protein